MYVGRINKETGDISRCTVDLTPWLDSGETVTNLLSYTITLGTTGWSDTPYPAPGSGPPYDPTPLLFNFMELANNATSLQFMVTDGTPGNSYTCQFRVMGTSARQVTFEVGVQITGSVPCVPPIVTKPIPLDALSIYGGTMLGPLYLYEDPFYPTEAVTKRYVDWNISALHVEGKVNRAGDMMTGMLQLYADPVNAKDAATKSYVDMAVGSTLSDAPNDGSYYGRRNLSWQKVVPEAPLDTNGYLRSNAAWIRGVPEIGANIDVRVTDNGGAGVPMLAGMVTPFSPAADAFDLVARRTAAGAAGDGGVLQLFGPTSPTLPNGVAIVSGARNVGKGWSFAQDGTMSAPGPILGAGLIRSSTGRIMSYNPVANTLPSVGAWDGGLGVASGFWVGGGGTIGFGSMDGAGNPSGTWATLSSGGFNVANYSGVNMNLTGTLNVAGINVTNQNVTNLAVSGNVSVGAQLSANSIVANGIVSNVDISAARDLGVGRNIGFNGGIFGPVAQFSNVCSAPTLQADSGNMVIGPGHRGRFLAMANPGYIWDWDQSSGTLYWVVNGGDFLVIRASDAFIYNNTGPMGGKGAYLNVSDEATKATLEPLPYGLDQILQINPIRFTRLNDDGSDNNTPELGFAAQNVQLVLPEAVTTVDFPIPGAMAVSLDGILGAVVNAIKTLDTRLTTLGG